VRRSQRLEQMAIDVESFLGAFRVLSDAVSESLPDRDWSRLAVGVTRLDVAAASGDFEALIDFTGQAAGRAQTGAAHSLIVMAVQGSIIDPILGWRNSFTPFHPNTRQTVETFCLQVIGRLRGMADEARSQESGFAGLVGRFVRFPSDVREAAGLSSRAGQHGAFIAGVAIQVTASLVVAGLLALLGLLLAHHA
jgi:hypothetical protein